MRRDLRSGSWNEWSRPCDGGTIDGLLLRGCIGSDTTAKKTIWPGLVSVGDDAFLSHTMKCVHLIFNTPHFCDTAKAHRLIAGQVHITAQSEQCKSTFLTLSRPSKRRVPVY